MRKLTVKDVAKEAGVSTATVSRVLNNSGYVSEQVRSQVLAVVKKLNYQPNSIARSLKQEKTRSIGMIVPDMTNSYFMTIARQLQRKCMEIDYHLLIIDSEEDPSKELKAMQVLMEKRVEAIVLAGTGGNQETIRAMSNSGIYILLIDRRIEGITADVVAENNRVAAQEATRLLLQHGHRNIGIIKGPQAIHTAVERYAGVREALVQAGLQVQQDYVYEGDYSRESGIKAAHYLLNLPEPPTAIFSSNNEMSYGLYLGMHELGMDLQDIEVVSFGDLDLSPLFHNRLSVVQQNPAEIGEKAGDCIIDRLARNSRERITPPIVRKY